MSNYLTKRVKQGKNIQINQKGKSQMISLHLWKTPATFHGFLMKQEQQTP